MCLRMIPWSCTVRRYIPTPLFTIRQRGTTRREWRFLLTWAWQWGRSGAAVGAGAAAGVVTTTSRLTATIISIVTRTSAAATATTPVAATARRIYRLVAAGAVAEIQVTGGSTDRNIAAAPRIGTGRLRTGLAARRVVIRLPTAR